MLRGAMSMDVKAFRLSRTFFFAFALLDAMRWGPPARLDVVCAGGASHQASQESIRLADGG